MKKYIGQPSRIEAQHIDDWGHVGMDAQSFILKNFLIEFMHHLDLGLEALKFESHCRFVVNRIKDFSFQRQLFVDDSVITEGMVWVSGNYCLEFFVKFLKERKVATEAFPVMSLIHLDTGTLVTIPKSIVEKIGTDKPEPWQIQPTSSGS